MEKKPLVRTDLRYSDASKISAAVFDVCEGRISIFVTLWMLFSYD